MWMWRSAQITPLFERDTAGRAFQRAAGRALQVAGLADRRVDAELELLGHRDLDLRRLARRAEHAHAFDAALGADDGELLLAGELAGLREIALPGSADVPGRTAPRHAPGVRWTWWAETSIRNGSSRCVSRTRVR